MKQETMGWQWYQPDHLQIIYLNKSWSESLFIRLVLTKFVEHVYKLIINDYHLFYLLFSIFFRYDGTSCVAWTND